MPIVQFDDALNETLEDEEAPLPANLRAAANIDTQIGTATQTALDLKAPIASPTFTGTVAGITKSMVGLANVDNTSDANKPISTATQAALDDKLDIDDLVTRGLFQFDNTALSAFAQRDDIVVEGTSDRGITVMTPTGRAGIDLIGDDGVVTGGNIHFWDATKLTAGFYFSQKFAFNTSSHPSAPNAAYMRNSADAGAHNHESMRWFFDPSTTDDENGNVAALNNFGVGVLTDIWQATSAKNVLTFADGVTPTVATGFAHVYSLSGQVRVLAQDGSGSQLTSDPRFSKVSDASFGPTFDLFHNSSSPAAADTVTWLRLRGKDSAGNELSYAEILGIIDDPTDGSEDGKLEFRTTIAGTTAARMSVSTGISIADGSAPALTSGYSHVYSLSGQVRAIAQDGSGSQLTSDPRFSKVTDGATGPTFDLFHNSASPAAADTVTTFRFRGKNSAGTELSYGEIRAVIDDATSTSEDGRLDFYTPVAGSSAVRMSLAQGLRIGATTEPGVGGIMLKPAASITPGVNGELTFEATSNTSVTVKLRGSDGVVRSNVLTLA